jgi:uncharacterized membrane protein
MGPAGATKDLLVAKTIVFPVPVLEYRYQGSALAAHTHELRVCRGIAFDQTLNLGDAGFTMPDVTGECLLGIWKLKRNLSITPRQFLIFYCSLATVSLAIAGFWTMLGAWTVLPFAGIDLIGVGAAFLMYARHATDYECIVITAEHLIIESALGPRITVVELNPQWVRIGLQNKARPKIEIRSAGKVILVGTYVPVHRRATIAAEMRRCIARLA